MSIWKESKSFLHEKSGKMLAGLSAGVFLVVTVIVFFAVFRLCERIHLEQINESVTEIFGTVESIREEIRVRSRAYESDMLTRAQLGLKVFGERESAEAEALERVRAAVSADRVSLLDGQGQVLASAGAGAPEEVFLSEIPALTPGTPHIAYFPAASEAGEKAQTSDGEGFVMLPAAGSGDLRLVFEFGCGPVVRLYNYLNDWPSVASLTRYTEEAETYVMTDGQLGILPVEDLSPEQVSQLEEELKKTFLPSDSFTGSGNRSVTLYPKLLGRSCLAVQMHIPEENAEVLMTVPRAYVIRNGIYIAASISAIIGLGILLLPLYVVRRFVLEKGKRAYVMISLRQICRIFWPGLLVLLAVTFAFTFMILLQENRNSVTSAAVAGRGKLQQMIDWRKGQESGIRTDFSDLYRTRTQMLASYLTDHPEEQSREGLEELNRLAGSDYLMRFNRAGQELASSNSYTGFSVEKNLGEEYRAVVLGYPFVLSGPETDPYTGRSQISAAVLMTDSDGQADGFLLAVYSAGELSAELKRMTLENAVNQFAVSEGRIAAAVSSETGRFIAHSDPKMIGVNAESVLDDFVAGSSFEGFTLYKGNGVCASISSEDGKMLLFLVPQRGETSVQRTSLMLLLALMLILAMVLPVAALLSARTIESEWEEIRTYTAPRNPMMVFYNGYVFFLTLFAFFAMASSTGGWWTTFSYVFTGHWSAGLHLSSLWSALFVLVVTLFSVNVLRWVLKRLEARLGLRGRTFARLAGSLVGYVAVLFLAFRILGVFGVNTTALLASAGIISIAAGMGAQSMAADLLAGFFMMLEGSVRVGDHVTVDKVTGYVTDMGIRTTEITDDKGTVIILNNSKVVAVRNMSRKQNPSEEDDGEAALPEAAADANSAPEAKADPSEKVVPDAKEGPAAKEASDSEKTPEAEWVPEKKA